MLNSKRKLKPKDAARFAHAEPALFREVAAVVCKLGILPEKELHECWQMAEIVHRAFPEALHIADLAAGHGLLGWILVVMGREGASPVLRTAVAVDITRPRSAEALAAAFTQNWPHLADAVCYVEGSIDAVRAGDGLRTVFVAVHACGSLSDRVLLAAAMSGSPVAIMPCCHSLRRQASTLGSLAAMSSLSAESVLGSPDSIDQFRKDALVALGYQVTEDSVQAEITAFHRVILASVPRGMSIKKGNGTIRAEILPKKIGEVQAFERIQHLDVSDVTMAKVLANRPSRDWTRTFDLSFWVDEASDGDHLKEKFEGLARSLSVKSSVEIHDRFIHPVTQQLSVTFRVEMTSSEVPISKEDALSLRDHLCQAVHGTFNLRG